MLHPPRFAENSFLRHRTVLYRTTISENLVGSDRLRLTLSTYLRFWLSSTPSRRQLAQVGDGVSEWSHTTRETRATHAMKMHLFSRRISCSKPHGMRKTRSDMCGSDKFKTLRLAALSVHPKYMKCRWRCTAVNNRDSCNCRQPNETESPVGATCVS